MKKITILLIAMLAFCWQGYAQFSENFEGGVPGAFTEVQDAEAISWAACGAGLGGQTCPINGSTSATFYRGSYTASTTSLVTPSMDLSAGGFILTFVHSQLAWGSDQNTLLVEISTDGGGSWSTIEHFTTSISSPTDESYLLDAYTTTATTQIRFSGTSVWGYAVVLDDVVVSPAPTCVPAVVDSSTVVDDCGNSQFSVDVVVSTVGDGTNVTDGLGGSFPIVAGTVTAGPYTIGDTVTLSVEHSDAACDFSLGDFESGCTLPGAVCENAMVLTPGTPQAGATTTGEGSFSDSNTAPNVNPCSASYNDLEYWFEYTAVETGETLDLTVTDFTNSYYGVFVLDNCPDSAPNCIASYTNGSSSADIMLSTPALTAGTTYYIVITDWIQGTTSFIMNSVVNAAPTCLEATNLSVTVLSGDVSATVSWDAEANATSGYNWAVMNVGEDPDVDTPVSMGATTAGVTTDTATGLTAGNSYDFYVQSNCDTDGLSTWAGPVNFTAIAPPANDTPNGAIVLTLDEGTACGANTIVGISNEATNDSGEVAPSCSSQWNPSPGNGDLWYQITAPASDLALNVSNISVLTSVSGVLYSGTPGSLTEVGTCGNSWPKTYTGLTVSDTYYLRVWDYSNDQIGTFDLCGYYLSCTPATMNFSVDNICGNPGGDFNVLVDVTDMGTSASLSIVDDQGNPAQIANNITMLTFGPYANGTDVVITATPDDNANCAVTSPNQTQTACPPANDECSGAEALTVNADYSCAVVTSGTVAGATDSGQDDGTCYGTPNNDVWYSFTATATSHRVSLTNKAGSPTDMYMVFYDATPGCGSLGTPILCSDPDTANLTGLTIGTTYLVQVYTYSGSSGATTTFDICVGTPPPPPANQTCATATALQCGDSVSGYSTSSAGTPEDSGCSMADYGVWYSFTGYGGDMDIEVSADFDHKLAIASGTCGTLTNVACIDSSTGTETYTIANSVDGETYYVYIAHYSSSSSTTGTHTISLNCPTIGIQDYSADNLFSYFPNPVKNTLKLIGQKEIQNVAIYNMLGQEVLRTAPNTVNSDVDMSNLKSGAYFVKVTVDNNTETIRIIKN
ncbi:T9SS type A sorting domain-containing protein [Xanthomarina sp. F1114]|uniref:T9SS type A sorting domain-containing protein n=1 Tax=Xanthomarina sp. F1114 TaxID=2996019 RepID=UPI00225E342E|nr:T9SS type A sorting domain-containing protein [Xanthomarina sp. F1114]MCX7547431.1 T9SS type A sorting domain-containing protein [Xanthomarina sp. F1114]